MKLYDVFYREAGCDFEVTDAYIRRHVDAGDVKRMIQLTGSERGRHELTRREIEAVCRPKQTKAVA